MRGRTGLLVVGMVGVVAVAVGAVWLLAEAGTVPIWVAALGAVLAIAAGLTGIANDVTSFITRRGDLPQRRELLAPALVQGDSFVDRIGEIEQISRALVGARCVSCHGQRGTGKSHLLGYIADVVNGHRRPEADHRVPVDFSASFYFDLADAAGFEQFVTRACLATFPQAGSWIQFVNQVDRRFRRERVLLILDNVNLSSLWPAVGKSVYEYLARRPTDAVLLGSIDPVVFHNLMPEHVPVRSFDIDAVRALALHGRPELDHDAVAELYRQSGGLPLYLRLLLANSDAPGSDEHAAAMAAFLEHSVIPELEPPVRRLIAAIGVLGHGSRAIPVTQLRRMPVADLERNLARAESRSLITVNDANAAAGYVRIHDIVRDNILRLLPNETIDAVTDLVTQLHDDGRDVDACIVALFGDPDRIGLDVGHLLQSVVERAVARRNYPLLETISHGVGANELLLRYVQADGSRQALVAFATASALAGAGRYAEAEAELLAVSRIAAEPGRLSSGRAFEIRFLLADVTHLQNRYDEALEQFHELCRQAAERHDLRRQAKCEWAIGHSLRHQGRDLVEAARLLETAAQRARSVGDLTVEVLATADASTIEVYEERAGDGLVDRLIELESRVLAEGDRPADMAKLWKERARVEAARGEGRAAAELLEAAIDEALRLNDRLLYDMYFERAELARAAGDIERARTDYSRVAAFANGNQDRNMVANTLLGLCLCEVAGGVGTREERARLRADALRARQTAGDADVQVTARIAAELVVALGRREEAPMATQRLIVF